MKETIEKNMKTYQLKASEARAAMYAYEGAVQALQQVLNELEENHDQTDDKRDTAETPKTPD